MKGKTAKSLLAVLFACIMLTAALLTGCQTQTPAASQAPSQAATSAAATTAAATEAASAPAETTAAAKDPLALDIFDNAANYQGEQPGWFGVVVKNKFNITLNILAPQISGDSLYQTRAAAGDLGDIAIIDNSQFEECIPAGLLMDLTNELPKYENLNKYMKHFTVFNSSFKKVNPDGKIFGMPDFEADTSPTTFSEFQPYSSPELYWPYYKELGNPEMKNLDDLLNVLTQMKEKHPTTKDGKPTIPITLWKDWDTNYMENVCWLVDWYGYEMDNSVSSVLVSAKGDIVPVTADDSAYYKILKFFFTANQKGLVDADSAAQDWNKVAEKLTNGQVLLLWYQWQRGFYNTIERGKAGDGWVSVPVGDMNIFQAGDGYYGGGRAWCVGAKAKNPARTLEFIDWLTSDEGENYVNNGIEGFNYEKTADGKYKLTAVGQTAFANNTPVPAEYGGGGYKDGISAINSCVMSTLTKDSKTGEFYDQNYWSSTVEANKTTLTNEWSAKYENSVNAMTYYLAKNMVTVVPKINASLGVDTSDIKTIRSQCATMLKDTSWKMVFAKDQAEFDSLWTNMKTQLDGLGWKDLVKADTDRATLKVDLRKQAAASK